MKANKRYSYEEILQNKKINNLYIYAGELIDMIKRKQCLKEEIIDGKYFWLTKKSVGCLISDDTIIERLFEEKTVITINTKTGEQGTLG